MSADGRFVAFYSYASNLVADDTNARGDIFLRDRKSGQTILVSKSNAGVLGNANSYTRGSPPTAGSSTSLTASTLGADGNYGSLFATTARPRP